MRRMLALCESRKFSTAGGVWVLEGGGPGQRPDRVRYRWLDRIARFSLPRQPKEDGECIADFFRDVDDAERDVIGLQIVTVGQRASEVSRAWFADNRYQDYLYLHGLSVEMAEAMAEYVHKRIRAELGFAAEDDRDMEKMLSQGYRGSAAIRSATPPVRNWRIRRRCCAAGRGADRRGPVGRVPVAPGAIDQRDCRAEPAREVFLGVMYTSPASRERACPGLDPGSPSEARRVTGVTQGPSVHFAPHPLNWVTTGDASMRAARNTMEGNAMTGSTTAQMNGADIIVNFLVRQNVPYLFGLCGHGNVGFLDAAFKAQNRIRTISVHHEQAAGHMADAYFKVRHEPVATFTSCGPGSANLVVALAAAMMDSSAFFAITGNVPTSQFNRGPFQETGRYYQGDFPSVIRPYVKRSYQPTRVDMMPLAVRQAWDLMLSGRPGPVNLDVPLNVFVEEAMVTPPVASPRVVNGAPGNPAALSAALDLLLAAERPVIIAGQGVLLAEAAPELAGVRRDDCASRW